MSLREAAKMALEDICGAKLCEVNSMSSRAEMLRLHALNAELVEALKWIGDRCPAILLDQPSGLHMEAAYDAGACARAALAKVEASK